MNRDIFLVMISCEIEKVSSGRIIVGVFQNLIEAEKCKTRMMKRTGLQMRPCSVHVLSDGRYEFRRENGKSRSIIEIQKHTIGEDLSDIEL